VAVAEVGQGEWILTRRMLGGEERAFTEFFDGYCPRLYRFAIARMQGNEDAAEEVVQNTLCKAISGMKSYRGEAALFTWLCTICRREIQAHYRNLQMSPLSAGLPEDSPEIRAALDSLASSEEQDPESQLRRREMARLVQVTLDCLPPWYGDALEWKYIHGLSVKEIADRLNLGSKAAESLLTRARQAFREGFTALTGNRGRIGRPAR
jgi:RNA polymerase sigma-70 factor, ECF subfamily